MSLGDNCRSGCTTRDHRSFGECARAANRWLDYTRGAGAPAAISGVYVQLHTGDPGAAGTSNVASVATRPSATFSAASGGVLSLSNTPSWATWAGTNGQTITHVSFWDASTSGAFLWSAQLAASKTMNTGDTLNLTSVNVQITVAS